MLSAAATNSPRASSVCSFPSPTSPSTTSMPPARLTRLAEIRAISARWYSESRTSAVTSWVTSTCPVSRLAASSM